MQSLHPSRRQFLRNSAALAAGAIALRGAHAVGAQTPVAGTATPITASGGANRQGQFAEVNGARIFYQVTGQDTPLLLIHGYPLSGALFDRNCAALSQHYQVITLDQRGYGMSTAPGEPDSIATYAKDALGLLDHLGVQKAIIGGHSMGGLITMEMYKTAPDRFSGMILIDTIAASASAIEAGLWQGFVAYVQQNGIDQMYIDNLMKNMLTGTTRMEQAAQVTILTGVIKAASKAAAVGGAKALGSRADYTSLLGQIKVPTLVFVGVDDPLYPFEISQAMKMAIPNSKLATIPGAAHAAVFESPDASNKAILDWAGTVG